VEELESRTLLTVFSPVQISTAYGFNAISFTSGTTKTTGDGSGQTIAIVDAYWDPSIQTDISRFSSQWGLPQLDGVGTDGTFKQVYPGASQPPTSPSGDDWTLETALDVEWAHAMAPKANIVLVTAQSDTSDPTGKPTDLLNAVQYAATQTGAQTVSMSWGLSEVPAETSWDSYFTTNLATGKPLTGVTFLAASGDSGAGTIWPAVSPNVVAVGGTTLNLTRSNTISSETGWGNGPYSWYFGGSGGGFSQYEPLPSFQKNAGISSSLTQYGVRLSPDVSYDANPNTGFYVLDGADGGWYQVGGTSAGAPQWAALVAIADQGRALNHLAPLSSADTLNALYGIYNNVGTTYTSNFRDITSGNSTGSYYITNSSGQIVGQITVRPGPGYDLVTGIGSPRANVLAVSLANAGTGSGAAPLVATGSSGSSSSSSSGTGGKTPPKAVPADTGAVAATLSGSNGSSSLSGSSSSSTTSAAGSSSLLTTQAGMVLTNSSAVRGVPLPATPANLAPPPVSAPLPTVAPLPPSRASSSANLIQLGSGGGDLLPPGGQPADDQAAAPDARAVPAVPPAGDPQLPIPGIGNPAPDAAYPGGGAFVQGASLPGIEVQFTAAAVSDPIAESISRLEPSFALSGLAFALVWHWRGHTSPSEEEERRRPGERAG
jgi:subtilase family serine protease